MSLKSVLRQFPMVQPDLMDQAPPQCQSGLPSPEWSDSEQSTRSTQSTQAPSPDSSQTLLNTKPGCFSFGTQMASILATTPEVQYPMISQHASAMQASSMLPRSKIARAQDQAEQKRLNQQITEAAKAPKAEVVDKVLALAEMHVERMNAINISTAMHRLVRAGESSNLAKIRRRPVMRQMTDRREPGSAGAAAWGRPYECDLLHHHCLVLRISADLSKFTVCLADPSGLARIGSMPVL